MNAIPFFDGHNDTLLKLLNAGGAAPERLFLDGMVGAHIDLPRAQAGGMAGGVFAIFPPPLKGGLQTGGMSGPSYDLSLPPPLSLADAQAVTLAMAAILLRIERSSDGGVTLCRDAGAIRQAIEQGSFATVLHIEGAEAIDTELYALDVLHAAGLRSLGLVWSRPNDFGYGVPFRYPSDAEIGPGLSDAGKALVRRCDDLGIMVDLSHLNAAGFRDVAAISDRPLVATHSNVHAICPHARNLVDWQFAAIRESGGVVGLNFATCFLRPDGQMKADCSIETMVRHIDGLVEALGEDGVALGSDFDGAVVPAPIGDVTGVQKLLTALLEHGYGETLVRKIASENWLSVLERTIG